MLSLLVEYRLTGKRHESENIVLNLNVILAPFLHILNLRPFKMEMVREVFFFFFEKKKVSLYDYPSIR